MLSIFPLTAGAQRVDRADQLYREYLAQIHSNDQSAAYTSLWESYQAYLSILKHSRRGDETYRLAKDGLLRVHPQLENAAAYFNNRGMQAKALQCAQAFIDLPQSEDFKGETFSKSRNYPMMVYFAASGTYNNAASNEDYRRAIRYFRTYLQTDDEKYRQDIYRFMGEAFLKLNEYEAAMDTFKEGSARYSSYLPLLKSAINACIDNQDNENLQRFLTLALRLQPQDETLLNIQGLLYEQSFDFERALEVYNRLRRIKPNSLPVARHIALNYYNLGVLNYNKAATERSEALANRYSNDAKDYFYAAVDAIRDVLNSDPNSLKYSQALATAYSCLGDSKNLDNANATVFALGGQAIEPNSIPSLMNDVYPEAKATPSTPEYASTSDTPVLFSTFAKEYVESRINQWQEKDPYETISEYHSRVNVKTRDEKIQTLKKEAEQKYIQKYTRGARFDNMVLRPYDAEHNVFLIESQYGELVVPVPRENNEARIFETTWTNMRFRDPSFYISDDKLLLSDLTFVTPMGKTYTFKADRNLNYVETYVDVNFNPIDDNIYASGGNGGGTINRQKIRTSVGNSDVDMNIPKSSKVNDRTFAVIIANEEYARVPEVPMALNDGTVFGQYCMQTLGLPKNNVFFYKNATFGDINLAVKDIQEVASAYDGDINVILYYAGHGIPNEATKDAFLLPVDADGKQTEVCYSLDRLYKELGKMNARSVLVFLDACFSGAVRSSGNEMLSQTARGVALPPRMGEPQGRMVVFSAASKDETALPYLDHSHGLFTYFLLKKLQETEGEVRLGELADYLKENVRRQSVVVNRKPQTPSINPSYQLKDSWRTMKIIEK